jgi:hypothetical protein
MNRISGHTLNYPASGKRNPAILRKLQLMSTLAISRCPVSTYNQLNSRHDSAVSYAKYANCLVLPDLCSCSMNKLQLNEIMAIPSNIFFDFYVQQLQTDKLIIAVQTFFKILLRLTCNSKYAFQIFITISGINAHQFIVSTDE